MFSTGVFGGKAEALGDERHLPHLVSLLLSHYGFLGKSGTESDHKPE